MSGQFVRLGCVAVGLAVLSMAGACASMQVPGNATTQALGDASAVTGAMAAGAALAPVPWGQILASALGAISVIAGIIAHSTVSKNNAQQVTSAVETGIQAASQSLGIAASSAAPASAANAALK
jgi:hypothetical protein